MGTLKLNKKENNTKNVAPVNNKNIKAQNSKTIKVALSADSDVLKPELCELANQGDGVVEEIESMRTENSTVYRLNNRTFKKVITAVPTRYCGENGEYKEISSRLIDSGEEIVNENNSFKLKYNKDKNSCKIFDLQKGDKILSLSAAGTSKMRGKHCGCSCELCAEAQNSVIAKIDEETEIQYISFNDRIKENIIVRKQQESYKYYFSLNIGDLTVKEGDNNDLVLIDSVTGETEFIIPAPFMYDANNIYSDKVSYEIDVDGSDLNIKVVADAEFINAVGRAFPVVIDPQIVVTNSDKISCLTEFVTKDGSTFIHKNALLVGKDVSTTYNARISVLSSPADPKGIILRKYLRLVSMKQHSGCFYINGQKFPADKLYYEIDYSGDTYEFTCDENAQAGQTVQFTLAGDDAPKIIVEYVSFDSDNTVLYENEIAPCIKQIDYSDKAKSYLYLKDGDLATSFKSFDSSEFVLPLKIAHIHKTGFGESTFGLNWRLNISKKLETAADDTEKTTRYVYTDELGDKYVFNEKYYYIENGKKMFLDKNQVTITQNGELTYGKYKVHTIQSCNGYSLLPKIDDFRFAEYIEQRQQEQIQLEEYVKQMEPVLRNYVRVDSESGEIKYEFFNLTKDSYLSLFHDLYNYSNIIIVSKSEALQLQSLYAELDKPSDAQNEDGKAPIKAQIEYITETAWKNFNLIKSLFVNYFTKKDKLDSMPAQIPVNYIKDTNGLISGFNSDGNLVLLCDSYGNYVNILYNYLNQIAEIYDSKNKVMRFDYSDGLLNCITDNLGRTVKYGYDGEKLVSATFADGSSLNFKYSNEKFGSVESSDGIQWKTSFDNNKFSRLLVKRLEPTSGTVLDLKAVCSGNYTLLTYDNGDTETYSFDDCARLTRYDKSNLARHGDYTDYSYGYNYGRTVTAKTRNKPTYKDTTEITQYNDLDLLVSQVTDWQDVSDKLKVKTETQYEYDLNDNCIKKVTTEYTDKSGTISKVTRITNYSYNAQGSLILTESYVEGEEFKSGKNYEKRVLDENGNVIKTISWNSLDSSSKFYSESDISENGQVLAERDETGEVCSEYEYVSGTNVVNCVKNANGGKIAYGRDPYNHTVTSVTQSTAEGEENCNNIVYKNGLPVEVQSGNTAIKYTYEPKGRKSQVYVNGKMQSEYSYQDPSKIALDDVSYGKFSRTVYTGEGKSYKFIYQGEGSYNDELYLMDKHEQYTVGKEVLWKKDYDFAGHLTDLTYKEDGAERTVTYEYDEYDRTTRVIASSATAAVLTENYAYNEYGELSKKSYEGAVTQTYSYTYKTTAVRGLDFITFGSYKFKPLTDVHGRNTGKEIYSGNNKVGGEYISYRKVGDHATNMPSAIWYASGENIKDSIRYSYDRCGNIAEIRANGHVTAKFSYDSLNRLVREDNKVLGKTVLYSYDASGNITERCEYAYTSKSGEELEELECEHSEYRYNGDVLVNYNGEEFAYNNLGCPTKYRGKTLQWQYGSQLVDFNGTTFVYDGLGRRIKKDGIEFTYDSDNRLIKQSNGLEFVYDNAGVVGFIYEGEQYFYRKDVQGNVIALLDNLGKKVVNYIYDAWGNHAVVDASGNDITSGIGILNPYRYRGYYYDEETGLYYLQTRYYDPELGRFISQDSVDFADPEKINGLNLYAYCGNNPVMNVDLHGNSWDSFWKGVGDFFIGIGKALGDIWQGIENFFCGLFGIKQSGFGNSDFGFDINTNNGFGVGFGTSGLFEGGGDFFVNFYDSIKQYLYLRFKNILDVINNNPDSFLNAIGFGGDIISIFSWVGIISLNPVAEAVLYGISIGCSIYLIGRDIKLWQ